MISPPAPATPDASPADPEFTRADRYGLPIAIVKGSWVAGTFEGHFQRPTQSPNPPPVPTSKHLDDVRVLRGVLREPAYTKSFRFFEARPGAVVHTRRIKGAWICLGEDESGRARVHHVTLRNVTFEHFEADILREEGGVTLGNIRGLVRAQVFPRQRFPALIVAALFLALALGAIGLTLAAWLDLSKISAL